jgi:hypothetical protein
MELSGATGDSVLFMSNPWSAPANASISTVKLIPSSILSALRSLVIPLLDIPTQLKTRSFGKFIIPANFHYRLISSLMVLYLNEQSNPFLTIGRKALKCQQFVFSLTPVI